MKCGKLRVVIGVHCTFDWQCRLRSDSFLGTEETSKESYLRFILIWRSRLLDLRLMRTP